MIRVVIVEDHAIVRAGLEHLLGGTPGVKVLGTAADGGAAVALVAQCDPDVVLMDISMPVMDGIEATRRIRAAHARSVVVVLTSFSDHDHVSAALDAGAIGYVLKDAEPAELIRAVHTAARGEAPISPKVAHVLLHARCRPVATLTARESDVLRLLGDGLPNKLIGRNLGISEKTVKGHVTRIFAALDVTDRTAAALWVRRNPLGLQGRASRG